MFDNPDSIFVSKAKTVKPLKPRLAFVCDKPFKKIFRFKVTLAGVEPMVWRMLEVPDCYSFWDFHVAISDAFDWMDSHLHEFRMLNPKTGKPERIGVPDEELDDPAEVPTKAGRQLKIATFFTKQNGIALYRYDFGDNWEHTIELEDIQVRQGAVTYPRCTAGERAGPPDDCGGVPGYENLLAIIRNPRHPEHADMAIWLAGMKGPDWQPDNFKPAAVHFDDPAKRWQVAFENAKLTSDMRGWDFLQR